MILIALGSNLSGAWGSPVATLKRAVEELEKFPGTNTLMRSKYYETEGVGPGRPGVFVNSVVAIETHCSPDSLLRRLKMIERKAGPRSARRWGPRTLDLDILDYRGRIVRWSKQGYLNPAAIRSQLVLPHPLLHKRPFVIVPLVDAAPNWLHPVLHQTSVQLWSRMSHERKGRVINEV